MSSDRDVKSQLASHGVPHHDAMPGDAMLRAALAYGAIGLPVFPCVPGTKRPVTPRGFKDATVDVARITAWWTAMPSAPIGMPTGAASGLIVVDVDPRNGGSEIPLAPIPPTLSSHTGGGGRHVYFRWPGRELRCSQGAIAPGVDVKADGGYVLLPPSPHPSGGAYLWADGFDLGRVAACPPDLLLRAEDRATPAPAVSTHGNAIPAGQRNAALTRLAGVMRRVGMSCAEIAAAIRIANQNRCQPPLDAVEVDRVAESVSRYEPDQLATAMVEDHAGQDEAAARGPRSCRTLAATFPQLRRPVIHGLLREGETMNVISAPKRGKSWLVLDLALSIATGRDWLGQFRCEQGDVLILDNELHAETSAHRVPRVAEARGIPADAYADHVWVQNLRGQLQDVFSLGGFFKSLSRGQYRVIILDAFYRFMPRDMDENDNGTMSSIYNLIDRYADDLGCCFVLIHHTSKGNQSAKHVTDVGAGAGSQSRATDTHLVLRPHEEEDAVVLDAAVRSWPPVMPRCLRWSFPVWSPADDLDPEQLRSATDARRQTDARDEWTPQAFVEAFVAREPVLRSEILSKAIDAGLSKWSSESLLRRADEEGLVARNGAGKRSDPFTYALLPTPDKEPK